MKILNINKLSWEDIKKMIFEIDENKIDFDSFMALKKYVPDDSEIKIVENFKDNKNDLDLTSRFFYEIKDIPRLLIRFETLKYTKEFSNNCKNYLKKLKNYQKLIDYLKNNENFLKILRTMIDINNILNTGNRRGNCYGFIISSLKNSINLRTNTNKENFLEFTIKKLYSIDKDSIDFIPKLYKIMDKIMNFDDLKFINDTIKSFILKFNNIKIQLENSEKENPKDFDFIDKFCNFVFDNINIIGELNTKINTSLEEFNETILYLGEKKMRVRDKNSKELLENYYKIIIEMNKIYNDIIENED